MTEGWAGSRRERKGEDRPQAGLVIFQPKRTLMHAGNSGWIRHRAADEQPRFLATEKIKAVLVDVDAASSH